MSATDRLSAPDPAAAVKLPCRVASTGNLTLSGLQTVDGVVLASGDRVLVKDQSTTTLNGIWLADSGDWTRATDFDGTRDVVKGTVVSVTDGTLGARTWWRLTTAAPVAFGTSSITFASAALNDAVNADYQPAGTGAQSRTVQSKLRDVASLFDFIPPSMHAAIQARTSTEDVSEYVEDAMAAAPALFVPAGTYKIGTTLTWPATLYALYGESAHAAIFDGATIASSTTDAMFRAVGSLTDLPALSVDATRLGQALTFASTPSLSPGEAIVLYDPNDSSFSAWRANYRAGEYAEVRSRSGADVTLVDRLFAGYDKDDLVLKKLVPVRPRLAHLGIIAPPNATYAIEFKWGRDILLDDLDIWGQDATNGLWSINKCFGGLVRNVRPHFLGAAAPLGTSYGGVISCSQNIDVEVPRGHAFRHAITVGGGSGSSGGMATEAGDIVNRRVVIRGGAVQTHDTAYSSSAGDLHGNTEFCGYENIFLDGGLNFGGNRNFLRNVSGRTGGTNHSFVRGGELVGFDHVIDGLDVEVNGLNVNSASLIDIGWNNTGALTDDTEHGGTFRIANVKARDEQGAVTSTALIGIRNRGCTQDLRLDLADLNIEGEAGAGYNYAVYVDASSGSEFKLIRLGNAWAKNASIYLAAERVLARDVDTEGSGDVPAVWLISTVNGGHARAADVTVLDARRGGVIVGTKGGTTGQRVEAINCFVDGYHSEDQGFDFQNAGVCLYGNGSVTGYMAGCDAIGDGGSTTSGGALRADTLATMIAMANAKILTNDTVPTAVEHGSDGTHVIMPGIPTSDPGVGRRVWNDGGTMKITALT